MDPVEAMRPSPDDLDRCAQVEVHTIAYIQPHGVLFALSEPDLFVRQVSANVSAVCGMSPPTVLGHSLEVVLGEGQLELFRRQVLSGEPPFTNLFHTTVDGCGIETRCTAHRRDGELIAEFELLQGAHSFEPLNLNAHIKLPLSRMESGSGILELSQITALETRRLSGFDRVMIYRFDEQGNGEVIAEVGSPSWDSYLGFRFPAADIPAPVRQVFLENRLHAIVDVDAAPVGIVPEIGPLTGRALDLTCSFLRSPAPVHVEYLRNMGVQSSLVVSIVVGNRLWGMIACHHTTPRHVDSPTRSVCELIGQMFGSQVALRIENAALQLRLTSRKLLESYMADLETSKTEVYREHFRSRQLLELFAADGLVLQVDGVLSSVGLTVENRVLLLPMVSRLRALSRHGIASSNMLGTLDQQAGAYALQASGALYVGLAEASGDYLLLVRGELLEETVWAGNPDESVNIDERGALHPRASFAAWRETVRGRSRPWSDLELESARFLREQLLRLRETLNVAGIQKVRLFESLQSTRHFRLVADSMPQLVWTTTPDGRADYFNKRWYTYTGISLERSIDWGWAEAIHPDDRPSCVDRWTSSVATGQDFETEYRVRRASGGIYEWHLARGFPLRNHLGEVIQWIGTCTNIEGQRQARYELEEAVAVRTAELRQAQQRLQTVVDGATNVAIIAVDNEGVITLFNSGAENLLGYTSDEVVGKHTPELFHLQAEVMARGLELSEEMSKEVTGFAVLVERTRHGMHEQREWTYVRKDGRNFTVTLAVTKLMDTSGAAVGFLGVAMDVTARKRAESAARASDARFRLIVETVEDYALIMLDTEGRVISWNLGGERIKGYKANEIIGRHFSCFYLPEDIERQHPSAELRIAARQGRYTEEGWRVRKDGSRFFAEVFIAAIYDDKGGLLGFAKVVHDITERKRAQERLQLVVEAAPSAMIMVGTDGLITLVNTQVEKLFQYERHQLLGRPIEMLLPERFRLGHGGLLSGFFSVPSARAMGADRRLFGLRRDGSEVPVEIGLNPIKTSQGQFALASILDLTARNRIEEQLEKTQARMSAIFNSSLDGIIVFEAMGDQNGVLRDLRFVMINPAAAKLMEVDASALIRKGLVESFPNTAHDGLFDNLARTIHNGVSFDKEYLSRRREAPRWYRTAGVKLGDGVVLSYTEITARKHAEEKLNTAVQRLGLATDALHAGIWDWDIRSDAILWDERMCEIYGIPAHTQASYQLWKDAVLAEDLASAEAALQAVIASKSQGSMDFRIGLPDGSMRFIQAAMGTILDDSGEIARVIGINIDITSRKFNEDLERQVEERTAQLRAANIELEEFAFVASHDLKAPLRVIDNASQWLEEDLKEHLTADTRKSLNLVRSRVRRMERLLDDLLEYARVGRALDGRYKETISGDVLINDVLELVDPKGFTVTVSPGFSTIQVCRMPLQQILTNLIGNAIKHHDKKSGRIDVTVEDQGEYYEFSVRDDGPGISAEFHDEIFKMFQTLKPRDQVEGSGMGLAMVRKSVQVFGGVLWLESANGQGSVFRFTWPKQQRLRNDAYNDFLGNA